MAYILADGQLGTGGNNGGSGGTSDADWANAYQGAAGLQAAIDGRNAGDFIGITRTFTNDTAVSFDVPGVLGGTNQWAQVIGYNYNSGSPIIDGTRAVIDANGEDDAMQLVTGNHYLYWENIDFTGGAVSGLTAKTNYAQLLGFHRCGFYGNAVHGVDGYDSGQRIYKAIYSLCQFYDNTTGAGNQNYGNGHMYGCVAYGNGTYGLRGGAFTSIVDCIGFENGNYNISAGGQMGLISGCMSDDCSLDGIEGSYFGLVVGNRSTNAGRDGISSPRGGLRLYNFCLNNAAAPIETAQNNFNRLEDFVDEYGSGWADSNLYTGLEGYEDKANDKYNLIMGAAGFRRIIPIDADHKIIRPSGICNVPIVWAREN